MVKLEIWYILYIDIDCVAIFTYLFYHQLPNIFWAIRLVTSQNVALSPLGLIYF